MSEPTSGGGLRWEIWEQPAVLRRLLTDQRQRVTEIAAVVRRRGIPYGFVAARGSSDHAGLYAKYLWGAFNGLPIALAAPSLFSIYHRPPRVAGALVVGISQSGQSPDIVSVLEEARSQGALTLAITNDAGAPLAEAAEHVLDLGAGRERAVAATKTYTSELMAIAMLSAALAEDRAWMEALERAPEWMEQVLAHEGLIEGLVDRYRTMARCVVLGRGFNYATAFEWALKLKELTYVVAEPYSSADFMHGPIAMVERGFPVLAVSPQGAVHRDMEQLLDHLSDEKQADLVVVSDDERSLGLAQAPIALPPGVPEWISPMICIVPAQLFSYHLARAKGSDPNEPRGLSKVTQTR